MKKIFMMTLLLLMMIFVGCGGGQNFVSHEKIVVGIDDEFPPMAFHDANGKLVGFDIDLAKETAERMGVEFEFCPIDWNNKKEEILSGHVDIIWNGLDITAERKEYMIFSKPYMEDRQIFFVKKDTEQNIHSENDIEGKIVGTQSGSTSEIYIAQNETLKNSLKELKIYYKVNDAIDALEKNEIELFVCDEIIARYEMNKHPLKFEIIDVKVGDITGMGIGFRKEDTELRDRVQKIFDEMIKDGTAKDISEKWFQADLIKHKK